MILLFSLQIKSQTLQTPLEKYNYEKLSTNEDVNSFVKEAADKNPKLKVEIIGQSVEGKNIPAVKISASTFGKDKSKIKVLIFAQQHGNEPSGKEGILLLLKDFAEGKIDNLLKRIDLILIPQMNPDGGDRDVRRNSRGMDLNRNHLILTEPETQSLHKLFNQYLPEVTVDVHQYFPLSEDWIKYRYYKNFDETIGSITNPNASVAIKDFTRNTFIPFAKKYLNKRGFSFFEYAPGGPPEIERIRLSTYDINDGRQSIGILNSFSLIIEGEHERTSVENIKHYAEGQYKAFEALLEFVYNNKDKIKSMVKTGREKLVNSKQGEKVAIRIEHVKDVESLSMPLRSVQTGKDTIVIVKEYHPADKILLEVEKPFGYLIPKADTNLTRLIKPHDLKCEKLSPKVSYKIEEYEIIKKNIEVVEEDSLLYPKVEKKIVDKINPDDYFFVPTKQLHSNMLVIGLEPQSTLGIVQYKNYKYLLEEGKSYPILRVIKK